jgi:hypothetical protein
LEWLAAGRQRLFRKPPTKEAEQRHRVDQLWQLPKASVFPPRSEDLQPYGYRLMRLPRRIF